MIEILWRGWTHWTMMATGGTVFTVLYEMNRKMRRKPFMLRCAMGAGIITGVEYAVGMVVNRRFKMNVWDYAKMRGNIKGQICPMYSALWFMLCVPVLGLCRVLEKGLR